MTLTIDQVNGMKVYELKGALKDRGLSPVGKKSELADRLIDSLQNEEIEETVVPPSKKQKVEDIGEAAVTTAPEVELIAATEPIKKEFPAPSSNDSSSSSSSSGSNIHPPVVEPTESLRATVQLHATSGMSATAASLHTHPTASQPEERRKCPYLDTVNRHLIDTDMEKVCSVSLSNLNVYVCLVCGKFFQVQ